MNRLRTFAFYQMVAWASLLVPSLGRQLFDDAEMGAALRERRANRSRTEPA